MTTASIDQRQTPYERRVDFVTDAVTANSPLTKAASRELAVLILNALDHIPERVR